MFKDELFLSPKHKLEDYKDLFTNLTVNSNSDDWQTAIEILKDRIDGRFLKVSKKLLKECEGDESLSTAFSVMTLNCLLIETLQQFYEGSDETPRPNKEAFVNFLMNSPYFNESNKNYQRRHKKELGNGFNRDYAENFYENVRCGLLHQAQTKKNVAISYYTPHMVDAETYADWVLYDVKKITESLEKEFKRYIERLKDPVQEEVRKKFCEKWKFIIEKGQGLN
ncbi:hypothetical protein COJ41_14905 [Bacillus thuringiensis]|uniref:hypothetical protein n=1 Tax=Bacillus thuringiensis TaxID=1428 RepID=UPI000BF40D06|nr:hypothetical protein [Bacillus thuringiensis]PEY68592.1 hypothetical protein CN352_06065 [Bacillus thuringiensis]PFM22977.1 hypothetical protein COJ41_14905 [Bacillus thuringiensis]PFN57868.1 hypothetical protein COJ58_05275 [Bacillus thuringiensis]